MEVLQCYICYEEGSDTNPLAIDPRPCDCKGSIVIHKTCLQDVIEKNMGANCAACGKYYNPIYIPEYKKGVVYDTGNHGMRRKYHVNERFEKHGLYQEFWPSGQIYRQINYENGKIHGLYEAWHDDGQLWICQKYIHGKTHTPLKYYLPNGKLYKVERFICDGTAENGVYIERYNEDNGTLVYCTEYYNGQKNGIHEAWDKQGNLESYSGYYQNDYKVKDLEGNESILKVKGKEKGCTIM